MPARILGGHRMPCAGVGGLEDRARSSPKCGQEVIGPGARRRCGREPERAYGVSASGAPPFIGASMCCAGSSCCSRRHYQDQPPSALPARCPPQSSTRPRQPQPCPRIDYGAQVKQRLAHPGRQCHVVNLDHRAIVVLQLTTCGRCRPSSRSARTLERPR